MAPGAVPAGVDAASRLEVARGLLRRMERPARSEGARASPTPGDDGRVLPVAAPLARVLPAGGLRRGSTVAVGAGPGSTSLLFALLSAASASGAWAGVVGRPDLGLLAAAEAGVRLDRLALVPRPGRDLVAVVAALVDGLDLVAVAGHERAGVRAADRQRLAARVRQRGAVLVALGVWPGADLELSCTRAAWQGLVGAGAGRLRARHVQVRVRGRGIAPDGRTAGMQLPGGSGAVEPPANDAVSVPLQAAARAAV
ncbi:hypothetical protein Psed_5324 [Pseudonocardia dioxanivorans CB1190]|uniref:Recombinase A n=2 Tax=Pseudonocardia dioxanivorans TaxID=240495 RepID=F4CUY9_PSEUX|nr:hypothetical protein Psed_5324 [Pseudonocardia dioxanivorans CB1190]